MREIILHYQKKRTISINKSKVSQNRQNPGFILESSASDSVQIPILEDWKY